MPCTCVPRWESKPLRLKNRYSKLSPLQCFKLTWPTTVHTHWLKITNSPVKLSESLNVTEAEGWGYIGMVLNFCRDLKNSIREHFQTVNDKPVRHMLNSLQRDRFERLNSHIRIDVEEMCILLQTQFSDLVEPGTDHCIDETIIQYCGDDTAVVYIPEKPHPEGFLCWTNVNHFQGQIPYLLNFKLRHKKKRYSTVDVFGSVMSKRREDYALAVADSWFPSYDLLDYCQFECIDYLFAFPKTRYQYLWRAIGHKIDMEHCKQAYRPVTNEVAVVFKTIKPIRLMSNHFTVDFKGKIPKIPVVKKQYDVHSHWGDTFNIFFYKYSWPHRCRNRHNAIFHGLLRFAVVNAFSIFRTLHNDDLLTFAQFVEQLSDEILQYQFS